MNDDRIKNFAQQLARDFPAQVKLQEPLADYTTYRVGGPAPAFCRPENRAVLQQVVNRLYREEIPFFILGSGSNILVHDRGVNRIVIQLERCCSELQREGQDVHAGAGVTVQRLVEFCEENNLAGLDFMSGIPGTVGGALRMNAGAFVGEIGDRVTVVEALTYQGDFLEIPGDEAGFGYRRADHLSDKILLGCRLRLISGLRSDLEKSRRSYLQRRADKQPLDYGSCGSVFKRPPGNYAGTLIEKAGCKGLRVGGAMVSPKHANFIVNYRNATAQDIFELIRQVQRTVYSRFKIWLEPEVKLAGFSRSEEELVRQPHE